MPNISVIPKKDTVEEDSLIISSSLSPLDVWNLLKVDDQEIKLKPYNKSEMLHMVDVALYLNRLILEHEPNENAELTEETAFAAVPEELYIFIALMYYKLVMMVMVLIRRSTKRRPRYESKYLTFAKTWFI